MFGKYAERLQEWDAGFDPAKCGQAEGVVYACLHCSFRGAFPHTCFQEAKIPRKKQFKLFDSPLLKTATCIYTDEDLLWITTTTMGTICVSLDRKGRPQSVLGSFLKGPLHQHAFDHTSDYRMKWTNARAKAVGRNVVFSGREDPGQMCLECLIPCLPSCVISLVRAYLQTAVVIKNYQFFDTARLLRKEDWCLVVQIPTPSHFEMYVSKGSIQLSTVLECVSPQPIFAGRCEILKSNPQDCSWVFFACSKKKMWILQLHYDDESKWKCLSNTSHHLNNIKTASILQFRCSKNHLWIVAGAPATLHIFQFDAADTSLCLRHTVKIQPDEKRRGKITQCGFDVYESSAGPYLVYLVHRREDEQESHVTVLRVHNVYRSNTFIQFVAFSC